MSRADHTSRIELNDLPVELQELAPGVSAAVRGGTAALTHEDTHATSGQTTTPTAPIQTHGIIAILIG